MSLDHQELLRMIRMTQDQYLLAQGGVYLKNVKLGIRDASLSRRLQQLVLVLIQLGR